MKNAQNNAFLQRCCNCRPHLRKITVILIRDTIPLGTVMLLFARQKPPEFKLPTSHIQVLILVNNRLRSSSFLRAIHSICLPKLCIYTSTQIGDCNCIVLYCIASRGHPILELDTIRVGRLSQWSRIIRRIFSSDVLLKNYYSTYRMYPSELNRVCIELYWRYWKNISLLAWSNPNLKLSIENLAYK